MKKVLSFLAQVQLHYAIPFAGFGLVCYLRLFGVLGAIGALAILLAVRKLLGKWDIKAPVAPAK
jgi:hypothetical protein